MRAAIISMNSVSSQMTSEAMKKYFDEVDNIDIRNVEVDISNNAHIMHNGIPFADYDCVFAKGSFRYAMTLRAITDVLKSSGKKVYLPYVSDAYTNGHDKILTHLKLLHNNIPTPLTYIASSTEAGRKILEEMNYPVILKIPNGTQGKGVMFVDSFEAASSMLDTLSTLRQPFLIQEYIETGATDVRVIVVGGKVIAAMKRQGKKDDKRSNLHTGGSGQIIQIDEDTKRIALKAAEALGAEICGVDILLSEIKGPLVIELNLSPGLQGVTAATKKDVPDMIAKYLADKTKEMLDSDKKQASVDVMTEIDSSNQTKIITNLGLRGSKLILPEMAYKVSEINDETEVELHVEKGLIEIKKM